MAVNESEDDDAKLARESRAGSLHAFDRLVERHHPKVFAFLLTLTRHRHDAEDLTQETFLRAWRKIDRYDPAQPLLPWLLTIARRLSIGMMRKRRPIPTGDARDELAGLPAGAAADPGLPDLWRIAERHLSRDAYSALWLHYRDELPLAEVGRVLGKREGAVKVLLHRARKSLARHLGPPTATPPPLPVASRTPPPLPSIWNGATRTNPAQ